MTFCVRVGRLDSYERARYPGVYVTWLMLEKIHISISSSGTFKPAG